MTKLEGLREAILDLAKLAVSLGLTEQAKAATKVYEWSLNARDPVALLTMALAGIMDQVDEAVAGRVLH